MKKFLFIPCLLLIFSLAGSPSVFAAYPEKPIVIILPAAPGGGYDAYAKALAPYLKKNLPNDVDIIIKHMPGAGMMRAANGIYRAKPDGYTIGYFSIPGMLIRQMLGKTGYDLNKVTWIGRNDSSPYQLAAAKNAPFNTIADMQKSKVPIRFASESVGTTDYVMCTIIPELMKIPYRPVTGYHGSREAIVGVMRGDGEVLCYPLSSLYKFFESGDLKPILLLDTKRSPLIPNTQTTVEIGYPDLVNMKLNRMIGGPPGIPADRVKILEEAIIKAENEPGLKKWSQKAERPYHPLSAKETGEFIKKLVPQMEKYVQIVRKAMNK
jgi:tripartite-type tricarboxylate transporter receptor subunit TctC